MANPLSNYEKFSILGRRNKSSSGSVLTGGKAAARGIALGNPSLQYNKPIAPGPLWGGQLPFQPGAGGGVGDGWL